MQEIASDVYLLSGFPPYAVNIYLIGDVLIDAGTPFAKRRILRQLQGHKVTAHALTHVHPDHQGASHAVCTALNLPLWCGQHGVAAMESGDIVSSQTPNGRLVRSQPSFMVGPPHPVARSLNEGDEVGGFTVIETPGHAPSHIAFWRESDRTLIVGDVFFNVFGLSEPPKIFTHNPAQNRESARKVAQLKPKLVCFGHGPPLRDSDKLMQFVAGLATD